MVAFSFSSMAQLPAYLPASGLMAWFPFTGTAADSTMHGHDGTIYGCTNAKGRYGVPGTALRFNGTSNYIYIPAGSMAKDISVDITASLTISAWVKSQNYAFSSDMQIYWRGNSTPAHDPHMLYFKSGKVYIRRDVDPGAVINEVGQSVAGIDTNYHLFTGTYDSVTGRMRIYVDGILRNSSYSPGLQTYPTSTMYNYIGAVDGGTWQFFYGDIDELGIWNRALSPCEVAALYYSMPNVISSHPVDDTVEVGGTATFTVSAAAPSPNYQWQKKMGSGSFTDLSNIAPYSGVNTATLTVTPASLALDSVYFRCVVTSDSCLNQPTDSAILRVTPATFITSHTNGAYNFSVSPNPGTGDFTLTGTVATGANVTVEVYDVEGRSVYQSEAAASNGLVKKHISLGTKLPDGTYFLKVSSGAVNEVQRIVLRR